MAIRLGNNCQNCENLNGDNTCKVHGVEVSSHYTCDQFEMKAELKDDRNCTTCLRYEREDCANPTHAAPGMMCASWAPNRASA
ncbi:hypothetical protein [Algoriphagus sediminis]|uniref:DUF1540 domain-containing protein n=1 Tax=Algoriphagus sediminis TaxID=3057113 RepID=A0ABT7YC80_9BACT|nr:hypothetical protein [Algoriphagus sediminis]MDN3204130.1 hypothetical protein [Algoriphagus sediminis]